MFNNQIAIIKNEISLHAELLETVREMEGLEGIARMHTFKPGDLIIVMPFDLEMFHRNRERLEKLGFVWDENLNVAPHCGEILTNFTRGSLSHGNLIISFIVSPDLPGSTCHRKIIGYTQKPIYEVICLQAEPM